MGGRINQRKQKGVSAIETVSIIKNQHRRSVEFQREKPLFYPALMLMKPGIAAASALASLAGMSLAYRGLPNVWLAVATIACVMLAACGSGLINIILEEKTDALMSRVAGRGRALDGMGKTAAWLVAFSMVASSIAISWLAINPTVSFIIAAAVLLYVVLYTLYLKKNSPFGTVLGAIPGALPVLAGYAAVEPRIGPDGWILFMILLVWQPPHFLALALKYRKEYVLAGFPILPARLGEEYAKASLLMYVSALLPLTLSLSWLGYCTAWFGVAAFIGGALFLAFTWSSVVRDGAYDKAFLSSIIYITAVLMALVLDMKFGLKYHGLTALSFLLN